MSSDVHEMSRALTPLIGERIRELRQAQGRSLADVAGKAKVSVATLSRIENDKQSVDLGLFLVLAGILQVAAHELLGSDGDGPGVYIRGRSCG